MPKSKPLRLSRIQNADAINAFLILRKHRHKDVTLSEIIQDYVRREPTPARENLTLLSLCNRFYKTQTEEQVRNRGSYRTLFRIIFRTLDIRTRVSVLSEKDIHSVLAPYKLPVSYTSVLRRLNAVLNWGVKQGLIHKNPAAKIDIKRTLYSEPAYFMPEKVEAILSRAQAHAPQEIQVFFLLGFYAGLRTAEILRTRWGDINLVGGDKFIRVSRPKGHTNGSKPHFVELEPKALALLKGCHPLVVNNVKILEPEEDDSSLAHFLLVIANAPALKEEASDTALAHFLLVILNTKALKEETDGDALAYLVLAILHANALKTEISNTLTYLSLAILNIGALKAKICNTLVSPSIWRVSQWKKRHLEQYRLSWGNDKNHNIMRHTYATMHVSAFRNAAATSMNLGHTENHYLDKHYKGLISQAEAMKYWEMPEPPETPPDIQPETQPVTPPNPQPVTQAETWTETWTEIQPDTQPVTQSETHCGELAN